MEGVWMPGASGFPEPALQGARGYRRSPPWHGWETELPGKLEHGVSMFLFPAPGGWGTELAWLVAAAAVRVGKALQHPACRIGCRERLSMAMPRQGRALPSPPLHCVSLALRPYFCPPTLCEVPSSAPREKSSSLTPGGL